MTIKYSRECLKLLIIRIVVFASFLLNCVAHSIIICSHGAPAIKSDSGIKPWTAVLDSSGTVIVNSLGFFG